MNPKQRKALYAAAAALIAVLVAYDLISGDVAPAWLNLIAAILGIVAPVTAMRHVNGQTNDYTSADELETLEP